MRGDFVISIFRYAVSRSNYGLLGERDMVSNRRFTRYEDSHSFFCGWAAPFAVTHFKAIRNLSEPSGASSVYGTRARMDRLLAGSGRQYGASGLGQTDVKLINRRNVDELSILRYNPKLVDPPLRHS